MATAVLAAVMGWASGASALTGMHAGVKGGVNLADLSGDGADDMGTRTGFMGGAFAGGGINEQFGIRLEGLFVQKGAEGPFVAPGEDHAHESVVKADYLEFPLLFTVQFPAGDKLAFNLLAGPTFGFVLSAELEDKTHGETTDIKDDLESFEFGAAVGAGLEYKLSSMSIVFDARYGMGATSIAKDVDGQSVDLKNNGIGIMAGVSFPLGSN
jgi:hypothetical protein